MVIFSGQIVIPQNALSFEVDNNWEEIQKFLSRHFDLNAYRIIAPVDFSDQYYPLQPQFCFDFLPVDYFDIVVIEFSQLSSIPSLQLDFWIKNYVPVLENTKYAALCRSSLSAKFDQPVIRSELPNKFSILDTQNLMPDRKGRSSYGEVSTFLYVQQSNDLLISVPEGLKNHLLQHSNYCENNFGHDQNANFVVLDVLDWAGVLIETIAHAFVNCFPIFEHDGLFLFGKSKPSTIPSLEESKFEEFKAIWEGENFANTIALYKTVVGNGLTESDQIRRQQLTHYLATNQLPR